MRRIESVSEVQHILLNIAKEFDRICTQHHIPYYMLGGTMLGAVRHKGFIPWDDDMDFGVPIEHYPELIKYLEQELPFPYRCCTYKNHPAILYNFIKIEDRLTCIDDKAIDLPLEQKLGVNIDVFPLNVCTLGGKSEKRLRRKVDLLGKAYLHSVSHPNSHLRMITKKCLRIIMGDNKRKMQEDIEQLMFDINEGDYLGNLSGRWGEKEIVPIGWYGNGKRYVFEDTSFVGLENYESYLTRLYGDYMQLPPEDERTVHVEIVYLR